MTQCRVEQRQQAREAREVLAADERVLDVAIVPPGEDPTDRFVLDVVVDGDGVPTELFDGLAFSLTLRQVASQGGWWIAHAVV